MTMVYLDGQYIDSADARISVLDRGFLFGDSVYEVVALFSGNPHFIEPHYKRLYRSCDQIFMSCPLTLPQFTDIVMKLYHTLGSSDASVYCQVSRGACPERQHMIPDIPPPPTIFLMPQAKKLIQIEALRKGASAVLMPDNRWGRCDIKTTALLANVLALREAQQTDPSVAEAIYIDNGYLQEGASSAVFAVINGILCCPPLSQHLLPSITRQTTLTLAQDNGIPVDCRPITVEELRQADELFIASATRILLPITRLDNQPVSSGSPGPIWEQLISLFKSATTQL